MITKTQIRREIDRGAPFTLMTADGKEYDVTHSDFIYIPPGKATQIQVFDSSGRKTILSLLMMTGIKCSEAHSDFGE